MTRMTGLKVSLESYSDRRELVESIKHTNFEELRSAGIFLKSMEYFASFNIGEIEKFDPDVDLTIVKSSSSMHRF